MSIYEKFGKRLKELRKAQNMTQAELRYYSGFSMGAIRNLEQGKNGTSFTNLERLADTLNVEVRDLFDFSQLDEVLANDDPPPPPMLPL